MVRRVFFYVFFNKYLESSFLDIYKCPISQPKNTFQSKLLYFSNLTINSLLYKEELYVTEYDIMSVLYEIKQFQPRAQ